MNMGVHNKKIDYLALESDIDMLLNRYGSADFGTMDIAEMTDELFALMRKYKIGVPKGVSMLPRAMSTIHGTLQTLDPNMNAFGVITEYMSGYSRKHFDIKTEAGKLGKRVFASFQKSLDIPAQVSDTLRILSKGISKLNMDLDMSDNMVGTVNKVVDRLVIAVIAGSLLIGSSIISTTNMLPQLFGIPALGALGFLAAIILVIWIIVSIIRENK